MHPAIQPIHLGNNADINSLLLLGDFKESALAWNSSCDFRGLFVGLNFVAVS